MGLVNEVYFENSKEIAERGIEGDEVDLAATTERYVDDKVTMEKKNDAGDLYLVAESYEDVYKILSRSVWQRREGQRYGEDTQNDTTYFTEDESVTNII